MNQEEIDKLHAGLNEYRGKQIEASNKAFSILTAGRGLRNKYIRHVFGDAEFETLAYCPRSVREEFEKTMFDKENPSFTAMSDACASFMASVCADKELQDKDFWIEFDKECGCLSGLTLAVFKELNLTEVETKTFR